MSGTGKPDDDRVPRGSGSRDIFVLCIGRCGHKWAVPTRAFVGACPVCGDDDRDAKHVKCEPVHVNLEAVRKKLMRAMRAREPRNAAAVLLAKRKRDQAAGLEP